MKKYFERVVMLFNAGDHEGSFENFLASYEERQHEKVKLNIASFSRCGRFRCRVHCFSARVVALDSGRRRPSKTGFWLLPSGGEGLVLSVDF